MMNRPPDPTRKLAQPQPFAVWTRHLAIVNTVATVIGAITGSAALILVVYLELFAGG